MRAANFTADSLSREVTGLNSGVKESKLYNSSTFIRRKHEARKQIRWLGEKKHEKGV